MKHLPRPTPLLAVRNRPNTTGVLNLRDILLWVKGDFVKVYLRDRYKTFSKPAFYNTGTPPLILDSETASSSAEPFSFISLLASPLLPFLHSPNGLWGADTPCLFSSIPVGWLGLSPYQLGVSIEPRSVDLLAYATLVWDFVILRVLVLRVVVGWYGKVNDVVRAFELIVAQLVISTFVNSMWNSLTLIISSCTAKLTRRRQRLNTNCFFGNALSRDDLRLLKFLNLTGDKTGSRTISGSYHVRNYSNQDILLAGATEELGRPPVKLCRSIVGIPVYFME
ncbi:hypothetical protein F5890DRAFT_1556183 [Lentinula detonsa]|uniref:Uncharacterized protein n=1 Tax=Lentinula detonsa TaxID=2804962 RepID=A0AA38PVQ1_9AGAR|nr:hypothetical protein F5890DRAFT_1556183 [Lentinula detonsa]